MPYFAFGFGVSELIIVLVIVLIFFGAGKLPKVMSQLGRGTKAFKDGVKGVADEEAGPAQIDVTPELADTDTDADAEPVAEAVEVDPNQVRD